MTKKKKTAKKKKKTVKKKKMVKKKKKTVKKKKKMVKKKKVTRKIKNMKTMIWEPVKIAVDQCVERVFFLTRERECVSAWEASESFCGKGKDCRVEFVWRERRTGLNLLGCNISTPVGVGGVRFGAVCEVDRVSFWPCVVWVLAACPFLVFVGGRGGLRPCSCRPV
jgi:hypothetical protein